MESLKPVAESVKLHLPQILHDWNTAKECESWLGVPAEFRVNQIVSAIRRLVDVALDDSAGRRGLNGAGETAKDDHQVRLGFAEDIIFAEYRLLRNALSNFIEANFPLPLAQQAIAPLDASATLPVLGGKRM